MKGIFGISFTNQHSVSKMWAKLQWQLRAQAHERPGTGRALEQALPSAYEIPTYLFSQVGIGALQQVHHDCEDVRLLSNNLRMLRGGDVCERTQRLGDELWEVCGARTHIPGPVRWESRRCLWDNFYKSSSLYRLVPSLA